MFQRKYSDDEIKRIASESKSQGVSLFKFCNLNGFCYTSIWRRLSHLRTEEEQIRVFSLRDEEKDIDLVVVKVRVKSTADIAKILRSL